MNKVNNKSMLLYWIKGNIIVLNQPPFKEVSEKIKQYNKQNIPDAIACYVHIQKKQEIQDLLLQLGEDSLLTADGYTRSSPAHKDLIALRGDGALDTSVQLPSQGQYIGASGSYCPGSAPALGFGTILFLTLDL